MSLRQTSFCFVCSHLTSGQKDGDELRRNSDVMEILRKTRFPQVHDTSDVNSPQTILEHEYAPDPSSLLSPILYISDTRKLRILINITNKCPNFQELNFWFIWHSRIIWMGDLNYRIALSYHGAKALVEMHDWRTLLKNDQACYFLPK
jgi:hypothetical protein